MSSCKLVIKDEVNVKFENLDLKWRQKLANKFKYQVPYAYHLPAVKSVSYTHLTLPTNREV